MCLNPVFVRKQWQYVPCGKCVECKISKSNEWAFRISQEARLYDKNCMITLTYNEDNLPAGQTLVVRDYQLFLKRLRKKIGKCRYFLCGEYGDLHGRPHYHLILFGVDFDDKYYFCTDKKGTPLFRSATLEKLWTFGFSSVGEVNFDTAKYVAIYMQKTPKDGRLKPFVRMSKKPAIGHDSVKYDMIKTDKIYLNGKYIKIPRAYINILKKEYSLDTLYCCDYERFIDNRKKRSVFIKTLDDEFEYINYLKQRKSRFKKILKKIDKNGVIS